MPNSLFCAYRNFNRKVPIAGGDGDEGGFAPVRPAAWHPAAGSVEITANAFAENSGRPWESVIEAVLLGLVAGGRVIRQGYKGVRRVWVVHVDRPDATLADSLQSLHAAWPTLKSIGEMRWYERCRSVSGAKDEHPAEWVRDYAALPFSYDGDDFRAELCAVVRGSRAMLTSLGRRIALERHGVVRAEPILPVTGDVRAALSAALSADVPDLVGTCLEKVVGAARKAPSAVSAGRLLDIDGQARDVAIADVCDAFENGDLARGSAIPLMHWRMARVLKGLAKGDLRGVHRRIEAYLKGGILRCVPERSRVADIFGWMACERRMRQWAAEPVGDPLRDWLLANRPDVPRDRRFFNMVNKAEARQGQVGLRNRKVRSDVIADAYDETLALVEREHASITLALEEFAVAHRLAADLPVYHHAYPAPIVDATGADTGELMLVNMRSVTVAWLVTHLTRAVADAGIDPPATLVDLAPGGCHHEEGVWVSRLAIYDDVERLGGGILPDAPLWARAFTSGALLSPSDLTNELVERRRRYYAETGIQPYTYCVSGLLRANDPHIRDLMRLALSFTGDVVVTIPQYHRGISMGRVIYRIAAMTRARITTILQIVDDERGWGVLPTLREDRPAFRSIPKLPHEQRLLDRTLKERLYAIDDQTSECVGDLIEMILEADGGDPEEPFRLAVVKPGLQFPLDCGPDRYVMQIEGTVLRMVDVVCCLSFLLGRQILPHDIRHAGAAKGFEDGESVEVTGAALDQKRRSRTESYIRRGDGRMVGQGARMIELRDEVALLGPRARKPRASKPVSAS